MKQSEVLGQRIFTWGEYFPSRERRAHPDGSAPQFIASEKVLELKDSYQEVARKAASYFAGRPEIQDFMRGLPAPLVLAHVPSHEADRSSLGLQSLLHALQRPGDEFKPLLVTRTETIRRLSLGGRRDPEVHLKTMRVGSGAAGKRVLVVDDVVTTGHSIAVACQLIRQAGALEVLALGLTRTV